MLGRRSSETRVRTAITGACWLVPLACARGIDNPLDQLGDSSVPITATTGPSSTVGPGAGGVGGLGATATGGASSVAAGGTAGATSVASSTGGGTPGSGGADRSGVGGGGAGVGGGGVANGGGGTGGGAGTDGGADGATVPEAGAQPRPTGIRLGPTSTPSGQQVASASGTPFQQSCAANEVVIGYTGTVDAPDSAMNQLRSFRAVCASLSVSGTTSFVVNTTTREILPAVGTMPGASEQTEMCPNDQVVVGFSGRSGADVDQIVTLCAPFVISGSSPSYTLTLGAATARPPVGGPGGEPFAPIRCPAGQVAVGDEGRAAFTINAFGLLCAPPSLVVQ